MDNTHTVTQVTWQQPSPPGDTDYRGKERFTVTDADGFVIDHFATKAEALLEAMKLSREEDPIEEADGSLLEMSATITSLREDLTDARRLLAKADKYMSGMRAGRDQDMSHERAQQEFLTTVREYLGRKVN